MYKIFKSLTVLIISAVLTFSQTPITFATQNLGASLVSDNDLTPGRSKDVKGDIARDTKPGAIGNGTPLINLLAGQLPEKATPEEESATALSEKILASIDIAINLYLENRNNVPSQHRLRLENGIANLVFLQQELQRRLYLYESSSTVTADEDYLLGFNVKGLVGLDVELINKLYGISPRLLAQYILHESIPERLTQQAESQEEAANRDDHRIVYREMQTAIFGKNDVALLGKILRDFITFKIAGKNAVETDDERIGYPLLNGASPEDIRVAVIGTGGFIRTELIGMIDRLNKNGIYKGKVVMVEPRRTETAEHLLLQGGKYETVTRYPTTGQADDLATIDCVAGVGSLKDALSALTLRNDETARQAFMRYARLDLDLIGIGVTEAGIKKDSQAMVDLAEFLYHYCQAHGPNKSISVINTDNVAGNGEIIAEALLDAACEQNFGADFENWLTHKVTVHNTMVDRIIDSPKNPAVPPIAEPVPHVRISIEDINGTLRVPLTQIPGVVIRTKPGEIETDHAWKLRILNAFHTAQVYVAALSGLPFVRDSIANPIIRQHIENLAQVDVIPAIDEELPVEGRSAADFVTESIERFENPNIAHDVRWIAQNAIFKIGQRFAPTIRAHNGNVTPNMAFAVACILRYATPIDSYEKEIAPGKMQTVYIGKNDPNTGQAERYEFVEPFDAVPRLLRDAFGKDRQYVEEKIRELLTSPELIEYWKGIDLSQYRPFVRNVIDMYCRMVNGEPALQVLRTTHLLYRENGPHMQAEKWIAEEASFMPEGNIEPLPAWHGRGSALFNKSTYRQALSDGSSLPAFNVLGMPIFDRNIYPNATSYDNTMEDIAHPFSADMLRPFNISYERNPWLTGMCVEVVRHFINKFRNIEDVEFMAEIRSRQDSHSALLIKFVNDKKLYVFDRSVGQFSGMPDEFTMGWYAPLYDGTNADECPQFDRYREIYDAYSFDNFVLNTETIYLKGQQEEETAVSLISDRDIQYRAEFFKANLMRMLTQNPEKTFVIAQDTDIGEEQKAQLMGIYTAIDQIVAMKDADGNPLFPNLRRVRGSGENGQLMRQLQELYDDESLQAQPENTFMVTKQANVANGAFDRIKGQAWMTAINDAVAQFSYLPIFESLTLNIMAAFNADVESVKKFYDNISNEPISIEELQHMLQNRVIYLIPKARAMNPNELRDLYERVKTIYLSA